MKSFTGVGTPCSLPDLEMAPLRIATSSGLPRSRSVNIEETMLSWFSRK
jgi:hypothetical protein